MELSGGDGIILSVLIALNTLCMLTITVCMIILVMR